MMINWLQAWVDVKLEPLRDERGWSVSTEKLLWIIGIIAMVAVVVAALNGYINGLLGRIR
ncbi:MAG: hypothetical protein HZY73_12610 [Micropruina sp.]|nr:MAG: hypothetical protein HZY73_12610 [Micropruina sp.]